VNINLLASVRTSFQNSFQRDLPGASNVRRRRVQCLHSPCRRKARGADRLSAM